MTKDDINDWKHNDVTIQVIERIDSFRNEVLGALAADLLKMSDKELGHRAGWIDCLATISSFMQNPDLKVEGGVEQQTKATPTMSFDEHLHKRLG